MSIDPYCRRNLELATSFQTASTVRLTLLVGALILACPLVIATQLRPAISGLGTHQQLGLPPCTARMLWGIRCPACGMTTSWTHLVRGQWTASLNANAGGMMLGLLTLVSSSVLIVHALKARMPDRGWFVALAAALFMSMAVTMVDWIWRLNVAG